jgi:cysteine synthase A
VTFLGDSGQRYCAAYFDDDWVASQGIDLDAAAARLTPIVPS